MSKEVCLLKEIKTRKQQALQNDLGSNLEGCPDGVYSYIPDSYCKTCTLGSGFLEITVDKGRVISIASEESGNCTNQ